MKKSFATPGILHQGIWVVGVSDHVEIGPKYSTI